MNITRITLLFQLVTEPLDKSLANQHLGGWSESIWTTLSPTQAISTVINQIYRRRAACLPASATIVGYRVSTVTLVGNRLLSGVSQSTNTATPGVVGNVADIPQAALQMRGVSPGVPNRNNFWLRGIPDDMIKGGEYQPVRSFRLAIDSYAGYLASQGTFGFIGRVLTTGNAKVLSIDNTGLMITDATIAGVATGDFVRFHRTLDVNRRPITGSYYVQLFTAPNQYKLTGITQTVTKPSGTVRKDIIAFFGYNGVAFNRIGVKKVGRPSEGYRGRRSRKTA